MFCLAWKYVKEYKSRSILTSIGVALSVALIVAMGILNSTSMRQIKYSLTNSSGNVSITLQKGNGFSKSEMNWIKTVSGVENISASYKVNTTIADQEEQDQPVIIHGINLTQDSLMKNYELYEGNFFTSNSALCREVLINQDNAEKLGLSLYDKISLNTNTGKREYEITGILKNTGAGFPDVNIVVYVPLITLENDMYMAGFVDNIAISIDEQNYKIDEISNKLSLKFGNQVQVNTFASNFAAKKGDIDSMLFGFKIILLIIFFIGSFMIYNTFHVAIQKRIRTIGVLKSLGMNYKQTIRLITSEGLILGTSGTLVGLLLGILAGRLLLILTNSNSSTSTLKYFQIPISSIIGGTIAGIGISLVASYIPAKKVSKLAPIRALSMDESRNQEFSRKKIIFAHSRLWIGIVLFFINLVIGYILKHHIRGNIAYVFMPVTLVLLLMSVILLIPYLITGYSEKIASIVKKIFGVESFLALRNLTRNINRTSVITSVMIVGIMVSIGFNGLFYSYRSSIGAYVDNSFGYDLYLEGNLQNISDINKKIGKIEDIDAVENVSTIRVEQFIDKQSKMNIRILAINPDTYKQLANLELESGSEDDVFSEMASSKNVAVIGSALAEINDIHVGDIYDFKISEKSFSVKIIGISDSYTNSGRVMYLNTALLKKAFRNNCVTSICIKTEKDANSKELKEELRNIFPDTNTQILEVKDIRDDWKAEVIKGTEVFDAMNYILLIVVLACLINTLVMTMYERKKEIAVLRSIGADKRKIVYIVIFESISIGVLSCVLGIVCGILFTIYATAGMAAVSWINITIYYPLKFIFSSAAVILVCSIIAAVYPAKIAIQENIVDMIKSDS